MGPVLYPRAVDRVVAEELLPEFPAILVVGPRGTGKSTSMSAFADTTLDLSEPGTRLAVTEDPDGSLAASSGTVLIDEWQEAPEVLGALKRAVDRDPSQTAGRFMVTGSIRAAHQVATWPGTGRLIRVRMYGLTQAELRHDSRLNPIDAWFSAPRPSAVRSDYTRGDYLEAMTQGRFPAVIGRSGRGRDRWYQSYVEQLVDRDAAQISDRTARPGTLRSVLSSCAARTGQELNKQATAEDADVDFRTADRAIGLLEDLLVIARVPARHSKRLKRLTRTPKVHLTDPGMGAHLLSVTAEQLGREPGLVGQMFETFVVSELISHIETAGERTELFHFKDRDGREVDAVLERAGRVVGIEVKSSGSVDRKAARGLIWLRDQLGQSFHLGVVLYSGAHPFQLDDRIWALPISSLWHANRKG